MQNINLENIIKYLVQAVPELEYAPGYDQDDFDIPYVALASFTPYIFSNLDKKFAEIFFKNINNIYNSTSDEKVLGLVGMEILVKLFSINDEQVHKKYFTGKLLEEFNLMPYYFKNNLKYFVGLKLNNKPDK